jgi:hypothetical protein
LLRKMACEQQLKLPVLNLELDCDLNKCGDDPLNRIWMGLEDSCNRNFCKFCFAQRGEVNIKTLHNLT